MYDLKIVAFEFEIHFRNGDMESIKKKI